MILDENDLMRLATMRSPVGAEYNNSFREHGMFGAVDSNPGYVHSGFQDYFPTIFSAGQSVFNSILNYNLQQKFGWKPPDTAWIQGAPGVGYMGPSALQGTNWTPILLVGGVALAAIFMMQSRR